MKLPYPIPGIVVSVILLLSVNSLASSVNDPEFTVSRMVMAERITDREPVTLGDTFSADTEKVYCFLEARDIKQDTTVIFVWYFENKELARVSLPLTKGLRWRTYSSKKLAGLKGNWKVELQETSGAVLDSVSFLVQ